MARKRKPWDYKRDKTPNRYKREEPRCPKHEDRYARLAPGSGVRQCRRSDGSPKRAYPTRDSAEVAALLQRESGMEAHFYECGVCGCWHTASGPYRPELDGRGTGG